MSYPQSGLEYAPHEGQIKAFDSSAQTTAVIAGTQSGKTSFGPAWLLREMMLQGPGDYLTVTPTFPLLELKALPEFRNLFERRLKLGRYVQSPIRKFIINGGDYTVYFGHAQNPESLESATAKGAWLDEAGQKTFKRESKEAINRRLVLARGAGAGRELITTTPYSWNWLKTEVWDKRETDPRICCISFSSIMNPVFPVSEYEEARKNLPNWRFQMFYNGVFTRPEGLIYDQFNEENIVAPFEIPNEWPRYLGLDFGGANTAAIFIATDPSDGTMYAYREYHAGNRTAAKHKEALRQYEAVLPFAVGGSWSEDQWRDEFNAAGLPVQPPPIKDVEVGIDRVYGVTASNKLKVFSTLTGLINEAHMYSRELDEEDKPTEKIEKKEKFHHLDALRYIIAYLAGGYSGKLSAVKGWVK